MGKNTENTAYKFACLSTVPTVPNNEQIEFSMSVKIKAPHYDLNRPNKAYRPKGS